MPTPTDTHIKIAQQLWSLDECTFLRKVENFVYLASDRVLRITEPSRRSESELRAELLWVSFLKEQGVSVASTIQSTNRKLVEKLSVDGTTYFASVFEKAKGGPVLDDEKLSPKMLRSCGELLGRMHSAAKIYTPSSEGRERNDWTQIFELVKDAIDPRDRRAYEEYLRIRAWVEGLPKTRDCYGLIHADFHRGNFFSENGHLTVFDFDDCVYHWFSYDIGTTLFYLGRDFYGKNIALDEVREAILEGYQIHNRLESVWIDRIPTFTRLRSVIMYHWCKWQLERKTLSQASLDWCKECCKRCLSEWDEPVQLI